MKIKTALITQNKELVQEVRMLQILDVSVHGTINTLKDEGFDIALFDTEQIDISDAQFYLSKLRKRFQQLPVILIVRAGYLESINRDWFFDDFIVFPFRKGELKTRIDRLIGSEIELKESVIKVGNITIEPDKYSVTVNNEKVVLTYKEFELLKLLMENKGVVFTRQELLSQIWGVEYIGGSRTVDVHIRRLRIKLGDEFNNIIETIRNVGYKCKE
ncbi:MAG TPA: response regulator transcription factor [Spirochaetota bacterium]|nr:response regulator transcription factor [Spirochaetota bacterium]HOM10223.1 response regulator transcription factor [Spirochaetota bacterium]HPP49184.1 response regulator transcription factor [Spirochaetota bacterium]